MSPDKRIKINAPSVIFDQSDGQTVIINLVTGHYFRLDRPSSRLWDRLKDSPSYSGLLAGCNNADELAARLPGIVDELDGNGLIVMFDIPDAEADDRPGDWRFEGFALERYTDLEDILGLDPIHEADPELGWPHARNS
jgi:hypothetical protein